MDGLYSATADTGRDFVSFDFTSCHRANSKANFDDAVIEYKKKHGYKSIIKILSTTLLEPPSIY